MQDRDQIMNPQSELLGPVYEMKSQYKLICLWKKNQQRQKLQGTEDKIILYNSQYAVWYAIW